MHFGGILTKQKRGSYPNGWWAMFPLFGARLLARILGASKLVLAVVQRVAAGRWLLAASIFFLVFGYLAAGLEQHREISVDPQAIRAISGLAYEYDLPRWLPRGDTSRQPARSRLQLYENGMLLGPAHVPHADIAALGHGRYSHWQHTLQFSSLDGTDPASNGRTYRIAVPVALVGAAGLYLLILGLMGVMVAAAVRNSRRLTFPLTLLAVFGAVMATAGLATIMLGVRTFPSLNLLAGISFREPLGTLLPHDLTVLLGLGLVGTVVGYYLFATRGAWLGLYIAISIGTCLIANLALLASAPFWAVFVPDSLTYFNLNSCRTPGYFGFLSFFWGYDPRWLVVAQINLVLMSFLAVSVAVAWVTCSIGAGILTLLLVPFLNQLIASSFQIVTEPLFASMIGFAAASAIVYARTPRSILALGCGLAVAAAVFIKPIAPVFLIAIAFLLLRPANKIALKATLLLGPGLLSLALLSGYARFHYGSWAPTNFSGLSLVGHVGWGIRADNRSSNPRLSQEIESRLRPIVEAWPSPLKLDDYVSATVNAYNLMLWTHIAPIAWKYSPKPAIKSRCPKEFNDLLLTLSGEAISRYPLRYAAHVVAHFYGLWALVAEDVPWDASARIQRRFAMDRLREQGGTYLPKSWLPEPSLAEAIEATDQKFGDKIFIADLIMMRLPLRTIGLWFGIMSLFLCIAAIWMRKLSPQIAALCITALIINAYFGGHALFQVALSRYSGAASIVVAAFVALSVYTLFKMIRRTADQSMVRASERS